jgi:uncharacterized protein YabN with tetrapyrrole methylase and pyrophosphatase domain
MTMTKKDILEIMQPWPDDQPVQVCIADGSENLDELEEGSLLEITDGGYVRGTSVLYVQPL